MKTPNPSIFKNSGFHTKIETLLSKLSLYFKDKDFDCRYFHFHEYLSSILPPVKRILNIGCGRGGETFALMLKLQSEEGVGIDRDTSKVECCNQLICLLQQIKDIAEKIPGWRWTPEMQKSQSHLQSLVE